MNIGRLQQLENLREKVGVPFIEPEGNFPQVKMKEFFMDPAVVVQPMLGVAPEAFNTVEVVSADWLPLLFPHHDVLSSHRQRGVGTPVVGEVEAPRFGVAAHERQDNPLPALRDGKDLDPAVPLEDAEDEDFPGSPPAAFPLSTPAKRRFIALHRPGKRCLASLAGSEHRADEEEEAFDRLAVPETLEPKAVDGHTQEEVVEQFPLSAFREPAGSPRTPRSRQRPAATALAPTVRKLPRPAPSALFTFPAHDFMVSFGTF